MRFALVAWILSLTALTILAVARSARADEFSDTCLSAGGPEDPAEVDGAPCPTFEPEAGAPVIDVEECEIIDPLAPHTVEWCVAHEYWDVVKRCIGQWVGTGGNRRVICYCVNRVVNRPANCKTNKGCVPTADHKSCKWDPNK